MYHGPPTPSHNLSKPQSANAGSSTSLTGWKKLTAPLAGQLLIAGLTTACSHEQKSDVVEALYREGIISSPTLSPEAESHVTDLLQRGTEQQGTLEALANFVSGNNSFSVSPTSPKGVWRRVVTDKVEARRREEQTRCMILPAVERHIGDESGFLTDQEADQALLIYQRAVVAEQVQHLPEGDRERILSAWGMSGEDQNRAAEAWRDFVDSLSPEFQEFLKRRSGRSPEGLRQAAQRLEPCIPTWPEYGEDELRIPPDALQVIQGDLERGMNRQTYEILYRLSSVLEGGITVYATEVDLGSNSGAQIVLNDRSNRCWKPNISEKKKRAVEDNYKARVERRVELLAENLCPDGDFVKSEIGKNLLFAFSHGLRLKFAVENSSSLEEAVSKMKMTLEDAYILAKVYNLITDFCALSINPEERPEDMVAEEFAPQPIELSLFKAISDSGTSTLDLTSTKFEDLSPVINRFLKR